MSIMSYMKKNYKIILGLILTMVVLVVSIIAIIISIKRKADNYSYLTIEKTHYIFNDKTTISFGLYSNKKKDEYLEKSNIVSSYIKDTISGDNYEVDIMQITNTSNNIIYENENYYYYQIDINLPIKNYEKMQLLNTELIINFISFEKRIFPIGSIILETGDNSSAFYLTNLKGIVNKIDNKQILKGIGLSLKNETSSKLKIIDIEILDKRIENNHHQILRLNDNKYSNEILVDELSKSNYYNNYSNYPIEIGFNEEHYFIELDYIDYITITTVGLKIIYEKDGVKYNQYIMPFQFFNTTSNNINKTIYESNRY